MVYNFFAVHQVKQNLQPVRIVDLSCLKQIRVGVCFHVLYSACTVCNKTNYPTKQMRKQVILIMEGNVYPFGQADESAATKSRVDARILVRKKHETRSLQQRNQLLDKIHIIKSIPNTYLMKIQTVLEEENSIHLLYEYVPNSLIKNIKNLTDQDLEKIRDHLLDLASTLAEIGFVVEWDIKNVGINDKKDGKYYLDLDRISLEKSIGKNKLQREHFKSIMDMFSELMKNNKINEKQGASHTRKKQIAFSIPMLNARPSQSIDSNTDPKNLKIPSASASQQKNIQPTQIPKNKQPSKISLQKPRTPLRKSRTNWKEIEHNEEFMQDFMNVLDDKSENAQSKYVSDEEAEDSREGPENDDEQNNNHNQGQEDEEIVWVSASDPRNEEREQRSENKGEDEQEQIVWVDYRDFRDIKQRVQAAIQRSTHVLEVFKSIFIKQK